MLLVTGATGFLGTHVCNVLKERKIDYIGTTTQFHKAKNNILHCNLLDSKAVSILFSMPTLHFTKVLHLAGFNGGISFNLKYPADIYFRNVQMFNNLCNEISKNLNHKEIKLYSILASCAYNSLSEYLKPEDLISGFPHKTVECHGYAKRHIYLLSKFLKEQYKIKTENITLPTLYGPGDSLDLERTKVMMALIKKIIDAQKTDNKTIIYGSGIARRQFLYVKDAARILVDLIGQSNDLVSNPFHIGETKDYSISELVEMIAKITGYTGEIVYDKTKPDGQLRKALMCDYKYDYTSLEQGIKETVEWYKN